LFGTWKDFRRGIIPYSGIVTYKICCLAYGAATAVYISWDFPEGVSGVLQDAFGGLIFTYQMSDSGSFTHPALLQLGGYGINLILTYQNVLPVELVSFTALHQNSYVTLNWQTATETNNQGFEVQRKRVFSLQSSVGNGDWNDLDFVNGNGTSTEPQTYSFVDENLQTGKFQYRLKQIDFDGTFEYSNVIEVEINAPTRFSLEQNYPNPFNPSTKIKYTIPTLPSSSPLAKGRNEVGFVTLKVYDVLGKEVASLVNEYRYAGSYEINFDASELASGVYYYQLKAGDYIETKKMLVVK
jgi:hypothetical protein